MSRAGLGGGRVDRYLDRRAEYATLRGVHIDDLYQRLVELGAEPRRSHGVIRCRTFCHNGPHDGNFNLVYKPIEDGSWRVYCKSGSDCSYRDIIEKTLKPGPLKRTDGLIADSSTLASARRDEYVSRPDIFPQERHNFLYDCHLALLDHQFRYPVQFGGYESILDYLEAERCITLETVKACHLGWLRNQCRLTIPYKVAPGLARSYRQSGGIYQLDRWQPPFWRTEDSPKLLAEGGLERWIYIPRPEMLAGGEAWLCEGAMDALAAVSCDMPAIAAPSSGSWITPWSMELEKLGIKKLYIASDNDKQGVSFRKGVQKRFRQDQTPIKVQVVFLPDTIKEGGDLTDYLAENR